MRENRARRQSERANSGRVSIDSARFASPRFPDPIIQRLGLEPAAVAIGTGGVGAVTAEQNAHMHFVGLALEPFEKSAHAIPAIILVIFVGVFACPPLAVDDEILIGFGQFLERQMNVDFFACTGAEQILLRFAQFFAAKNADRALAIESAIGDRAIQIDRDGAPEAAAFRTCA